MNTLFNRNVEVIWGPTREIITSIPFLVSNTTEGLNVINASDSGWPYFDYLEPPLMNKTASKLKIEFNIKKDFEKATNEAIIKIYNLRQDKYLITEDESKTKYKVYLYVGYGDTYHKLFGGDIEESSYVKEGPNWVFTIKAKDGQTVMDETIINKSYTGGMILKNVMLDMIKDSSDKTKDQTKLFFTKKVKKWVEDNVSSSFKVDTGLSVTGRLMDQFDKFMDEIGGKLSVQDEKMEIIWKDSNNKNDIVLLSPNSGLIGSPIRKKDNYIEFKSLLIPMISPGGLVKIESRQVNDYFRIDKVDYIGDTHSQSWECRCEGMKPTNLDTSPPEIQYYEVINNIAVEDEAKILANV